MECSEFIKLIPEFTFSKLNYRKAQEMLEHVENCSACRDELEIYLIVEQVLDESTDASTPFVLEKRVYECFSHVKKSIKRQRRKHYFLTFLKYLSYVVIILGLICLITFLI